MLGLQQDVRSTHGIDEITVDDRRDVFAGIILP